MKPIRFASIAQCAGKKRFESYEVAKKARHHLTHLDIYRCPHCGQFHLGNKPKGQGRPKPPPPAIELEF